MGPVNSAQSATKSSGVELDFPAGLFRNTDSEDIEKLLAGVETDLPEKSKPDFAGQFDLRKGRITLTDALPPERDWVIDGLLLRSTLSILAGAGGASKTALMIEWAVHIATGRPWGPCTVKPGSAVLYLGEEPAEEVDRRVNAVVKTLDLSAQEKTLVKQRLLIFPLAGSDFRLTELHQGNVTATDVGPDMIQVCRALEFDSGVSVKLVGIDHAKLVMSGDGNAAADVTALTRALTDIAVKSGAATLLLAHSPKSSHNSDQQASAADVAGNSAFVDNARIAMLLRTLREEEAKLFGITSESRKNYALLDAFKNNYGASGIVTHLVRHVVEGYQTAVPLPLTLTPVKKDGPGKPGLHQKIVDFVRAKPGQLTRNKLCSQYSGKEGPFKVSDKELERTLATLIDLGELTLRIPSDEERKEYGLTHNVRHILDVPPPVEKA